MSPSIGDSCTGEDTRGDSEAAASVQRVAWVSEPGPGVMGSWGAVSETGGP
jgi:hypothetical protein